MGKKTLLLSANYEVLALIHEKRAIKLLIKDKVDVVSAWDDSLKWFDDEIKQPSIIRLKSQIKRHSYFISFSRASLVRRDKSICQYCSKSLTAANVTIDHVLPKSLGGGTSFSNCVVSCKPCNSKKANRTPEQANMTLLKRPMSPSFQVHLQLKDGTDHWHTDWDMFLNKY